VKGKGHITNMRVIRLKEQLSKGRIGRNIENPRILKEKKGQWKEITVTAKNSLLMKKASEENIRIFSKMNNLLMISNRIQQNDKDNSSNNNSRSNNSSSNSNNRRARNLRKEKSMKKQLVL
jgi:hypothetical protein